MRVKDVMTADVLTVGPEAPIKDVAKILVENRISGIPVCDLEGTVLGVVSEGDILWKEHDPRDAHTGSPLGWVVDGSPNFAGYVKSGARQARQAMTSPPVTITPHEPVAEAARRMCEHQVNRLPVVHEGRLVGIVTRADLVRAFIRTDAELAREIRDDVLRRTMWVDPGRVTTVVENGVVVLYGALQTRSDVELLGRLVARVPGVLEVRSNVEWAVDDRTRRGRRALASR